MEPSSHDHARSQAAQWSRLKERIGGPAQRSLTPNADFHVLCGHPSRHRAAPYHGRAISFVDLGIACALLVPRSVPGHSGRVSRHRPL